MWTLDWDWTRYVTALSRSRYRVLLGFTLFFSKLNDSPSALQYALEYALEKKEKKGPTDSHRGPRKQKKNDNSVKKKKKKKKKLGTKIGSWENGNKNRVQRPGESGFPCR